MQPTEHQANDHAARERAELYYMAHPRTPSAARRPVILFEDGLWRAALGEDFPGALIATGPTVESALAAFDALYLDLLRGPAHEAPSGEVRDNRHTPTA